MSSIPPKMLEAAAAAALTVPTCKHNTAGQSKLLLHEHNPVEMW